MEMETFLFPLGRLFATPGALQALEDSGDRVETFLARHSTGDWGDVCDDDKKENDFSVTNGFRLLSVYRLRDGTKIWLITEADRSSTTMLLPSEYQRVLPNADRRSPDEQHLEEFRAIYKNEIEPEIFKEPGIATTGLLLEEGGRMVIVLTIWDTRDDCLRYHASKSYRNFVAKTSTFSLATLS